MKKVPFFFFPFLIFLGVLLLFSACKKSFSAEKVNVLLVTIDTLRPDRLSCYGGEFVETKNIDSIAEKGVIFERAFAHNPLTLPSHANILLGLTPLYHGVHDNAGFRVEDKFLTLAEHLRKNGYATAAFVGAFPLDSRFGLDQGFDVYDDNFDRMTGSAFFFAERRAEKVINGAIAWLKREKRERWFLWLHLFDPHQPYSPPPPFEKKFENDLYSGEVAYVDEQLGRLFAFLRSRGLMEKTLIIITADHGESLGEHGEDTHGYFAYNSTLHVPLIFYKPDKFAPRRVKQKVSHIDIFPTICEILGIKTPSVLQGRSLLPALLGEKMREKPIYFESLSPYFTRGWAPLRGFINGRFKFIDLPLKELYDIEKDFNEKRNLAPTVKIEKFSRQLKELMEKLRNPEGTPKRKIEDRKTMEILRSLGYVSGFSEKKKARFTAADDLKVLLPLHKAYLDAIKAFTRGRRKKAISLMETVIKKRKDFSQAYMMLGTFYRMEDDLERSISVMKEGVKENPHDYRLLSTLGITLVEADMPEEAEAYLKRAIAVVDYDPETWNYLGVAYWKMGKFDEAIEAYKKALSLDPSYAAVYNNLGSLFVSMKIPEDAIGYFRKAIRYDPAMASAYNGLAASYKLMGKVGLAVKFWKKALQIEPNHLMSLYNLGMTLAEMNRKEEARKYLEKYIKILGPNLNPYERIKINRILNKK